MYLERGACPAGVLGNSHEPTPAFLKTYFFFKLGEGKFELLSDYIPHLKKKKTKYVLVVRVKLNMLHTCEVFKNR